MPEPPPCAAVLFWRRGGTLEGAPDPLVFRGFTGTFIGYLGCCPDCPKWPWVVETADGTRRIVVLPIREGPPPAPRRRWERTLEEQRTDLSARQLPYVLDINEALRIVKNESHNCPEIVQAPSVVALQGSVVVGGALAAAGCTRIRVRVSGAPWLCRMFLE